MLWQDLAIIIDNKKYGENSAIVTVLTKDNGLYRGFVTAGYSGKNRPIYQIGNYVDLIWRARLHEQLGYFTAELSLSVAAQLIFDAKRLAALAAIAALIAETLPEREPNYDIYKKMYNFTQLLLVNNNDWIKYYVEFEIELIKNLGFEIDFSKCVASGVKEDLIYVSPKSGCAVSKDAGEPYKNKLLKLPRFLKGDNDNLSNDCIKNGLILTGFFLQKYHFAAKFRGMPFARTHFVDLIMKAAIKA